MSDPIQTVTRYKVRVKARVRATVETIMTFTDQDVREWAGLEGDAMPDPELIEEYASEEVDEGAVELDDIHIWDQVDVEMLSTEKTVSVPPSFVPLPGMESL